MSYLPSPSGQAWILEHLRELIRYRGRDTFLTAPLLEPTPAYFPDRWAPRAERVERIVRRIMGYAGLSQFGVHLEIYDGADALPAECHAGQVAAWFEGLDLGVARFGVDVDSLSDGPSLIGILCHEVAHAYRLEHKLRYHDRHQDEPLTDLTTIYLGFGILSANSSDHYRVDAQGISDGVGGYLTSQAMSFALASQVVARRLGREDRKKVAGFLNTNQAAYFVAACEHLDRDPSLLPCVAESAARPDAFNHGLPVYRVKPGWLRADRCSDADCRAKLAATDRTCPRCGGTIAGEVRSEEEAAAKEAEVLAAGSPDELARLLRGSRPG